MRPVSRSLVVGAVLAWALVLAGCLLLWSSFRDPSAVPAPGSWPGRLLALLGGVPYDDPALVARVRITRIAVILGAGVIALIGVVERDRVVRAVRRYFTTPSHAVNLAIFRIVVFCEVYRLGYFDFIARIVALPDALQAPPPTGIPAIGPLAALSHWPPNPLGPEGVLLLGQVMKAACIAGAVGLLTRTSALVAAFTFFYGWGAMQWYGKVDHHHHLLWFLLVLAASRAGDALSVDGLVRAWRRGRRGETEPPGRAVAYGLPLRICILLMGVLYFFPGFWKIWRSGFDWFLGDNPFNQMYLKWTMLGEWLPPARPDAWPVLVHAGALGTILFELSFIFLIFGRRTFYLVGAAGVAFHTGIDFFMRHGFGTLRNSYVAFVDWQRGLAWAGRRAFRRDLTVAWDPRDRALTTQVAVARALDWFDLVTWREAGGASGLEARVGGRTWRGGAALRPIARRLPLAWPLAIPLHLVPARWLEGAAREPRRPAPGLSGRPAGARMAVVGPLAVGATLFVGNAWAGLNRLQEGWPLACYPLFDGLIEESYTTLRILAIDGRGAERVLVPDDYRDRLGENWNEVLQRIIHQDDEARRQELLHTVWEVLETDDPAMAEVRLVRFYTVRSSLRPDRWDRPPGAPELILTMRR